MKTVAVIFGGRSTEHDISIVTALSSVIRPLEISGKYNVEAIYISKKGDWYCDERLKDIALFSSGEIDNFVRKQPAAEFVICDGLQLVRSKGISGRKRIKIDVVFPAMHGTYGEDGALMGFLDMAGVPYVGCPMPASVLAMDKVLAKQAVAAADIPVVPYKSFSKQEFADDPDAIIEQICKKLQYPFFVKPAHLGSSIGITRATDEQGLRNAIEVAAHFDDKVLVEEEVPNLIEVTLPIIGNDELRPSLLERPLTSAEDFFDFDTKYMSGGKKGGKGKSAQQSGKQGAQGYSELPAQLPSDLYKQAESTGLAVYRALECAGIARVDMLIDSKASKVYFNEVNPLPGGLYAHNWRASGLSTVALVESLVQLAEERAVKQARTETVFTTNYLKQF